MKQKGKGGAVGGLLPVDRVKDLQICPVQRQAIWIPAHPVRFRRAGLHVSLCLPASAPLSSSPVPAGDVVHSRLMRCVVRPCTSPCHSANACEERRTHARTRTRTHTHSLVLLNFQKRVLFRRALSQRPVADSLGSDNSAKSCSAKGRRAAVRMWCALWWRCSAPELCQSHDGAEPASVS